MCTPENTVQKTRKRRYGKLEGILQIDKDKLLDDARSWPETKDVNWSLLARQYGIDFPNGGQIIKEFLVQHNIPAASVNQRPSQAK